MSKTHLINPIVSLDGKHVMSHSEDYAKLTKFFSSDEFKALAEDRDLDKHLLVDMSQELTNFLREKELFEWSPTCVAVVSRVVVDPIDADTDKVVVELAVISEPETDN